MSAIRRLVKDYNEGRITSDGLCIRCLLAIEGDDASKLDELPIQLRPLLTSFLCEVEDEFRVLFGQAPTPSQVREARRWTQRWMPSD